MVAPAGVQGYPFRSPVARGGRGRISVGRYFQEVAVDPFAQLLSTLILGMVQLIAVLIIQFLGLPTTGLG